MNSLHIPPQLLTYTERVLPGLISNPFYEYRQSYLAELNYQYETCLSGGDAG